MGISSLNSAILYNVSLYFHCHLERPQRVEKSKSYKYNKYPELSSTKTALFLDGMLIFPFPSMKSGIFTHREMKFGIGTFMHQVLFNELIYLSLIMISSWNFIY